MLESLSLRIALGRREFEDVVVVVVVVVVVCSSFLFSDCLHTTSPVVPFFLLSPSSSCPEIELRASRRSPFQQQLKRSFLSLFARALLVTGPR